MTPRRERFPKRLRLRKRGEFERVFGRPRRSTDELFTVLARRNRLPYPRLGMAISRKHAPRAVVRNRVKRLVREVVRRNRERFPEGCDVVAIAKRGSPELGYEDVRSEITNVERAMRSALDRARTRREQDR